MPDEEAPSDAAVEDQLRQATKRFLMLTEHGMQGSPTRSSLTDCTMRAFMPHRPPYTTEGMILAPMAVFSPYSDQRSLVKAMHRAKTVAF